MTPATQAFLTKNGAPSFPNAKFRGEGKATYTTIFGPDYSGATGKSVRTHIAWDRGHGDLWRVFSPFDIELAEGFPHDDFGYMLVLHPVGADFTLRIAHMHPTTDIEPAIQKAIANKTGFPAGTYLGKCGSYSVRLKVGVHTHTEIVSKGETSDICEELLKQKFGAKVWHDEAGLNQWVVDTYSAYCKTWPAENKPVLTPALQKDIVAALKEDMKGRRVLQTSKYAVLKNDYLGEVKRTWYSSKDLFNF